MRNVVGVNRDNGTPIDDRRRLELSGKHNKYTSTQEKEVSTRGISGESGQSNSGRLDIKHSNQWGIVYDRNERTRYEWTRPKKGIYSERVRK